MGEDKRPYRIAINVSAELKERHDAIFRWGEWNQVGVQIIEWLCEMHDIYGDVAFLLFRSGELEKLLKLELPKRPQE